MPNAHLRLRHSYDIVALNKQRKHSSHQAQTNASNHTHKLRHHTTQESFDKTTTAILEREELGETRNDESVDSEDLLVIEVSSCSGEELGCFGEGD